MYHIVLSRSARKDLDEVNQKYKPHIFAAFFDLRRNPFLGKKLKGGLRDYYSLRIGVYRIIYRIYKQELDILVIHIDHRQGAYK